MSDEDKKKEALSGGIHIGGDVGSGAAIGEGASVEATNIAGRDISGGVSPDEVANAFARIYAAIEEKPFASEEKAKQVREAVEIIETENEKGDKANEKIVRMSLKTLALMAPDIWEVAVTTFTNPIRGISTVVKKIAEKAAAER